MRRLTGWPPALTSTRIGSPSRSVDPPPSRRASIPESAASTAEGMWSIASNDRHSGGGNISTSITSCSRPANRPSSSTSLVRSASLGTVPETTLAPSGAVRMPSEAQSICRIASRNVCSALFGAAAAGRADWSAAVADCGQIDPQNTAPTVRDTTDSRIAETRPKARRHFIRRGPRRGAQRLITALVTNQASWPATWFGRNSTGSASADRDREQCTCGSTIRSGTVPRYSPLKRVRPQDLIDWVSTYNDALADQLVQGFRAFSGRDYQALSHGRPPCVGLPAIGCLGSSRLR